VTQPVTELPETGADTNALMIGLLASAAAYGAVYFAQPKRRYE
jgi:LPXTG-motif cell wall-anchored protein